MSKQKEPLEKLIAAIRAEAEREEFSIDKPVYEKAKRNSIVLGWIYASVI